MTLEQLVRQEVQDAAGRTPEAMAAGVERVVLRARRRTRIKRTSIAVTAVLVFVGVLAIDLFPGVPGEVASPVDGEVLRIDPLIIRGEPGPDPRFDTSSLGSRVDLTPVGDLDGFINRVRPSRGPLIDLIESYTSPSHAGFDQMVTAGYTPGGVAVAITFSTTWSPGEGTTYWVCVSDDAGSACAGDHDQQPERPWSGSGAMTVGGPGVLSWTAHADTAVAMLTVNGERFWQRPVGGLAAFDTDLRAGDRLTYSEFDADGRLIAVNHEVAAGDRAVAVCPVTYPSGGFSAPDPWPDHPAHVGMVWYGSDDLWTALPVDGHGLGGSKTVFWSAEFSGGVEEPEPNLDVTYRRLDAEQPPITNEGQATNGLTDEDGWFMIGGINPDQAGCWEVTATYRGSTLSYVYEVRES